MDDGQIIRTGVAATVAVFFGSLARRARELDGLEVIQTRTLLRMFWIELMLMPAFATVAAVLVMWREWPWWLALPIGICAGLGGFATGTLIFEIFRSAVQTMAGKMGGGDA